MIDQYHRRKAKKAIPPGYYILPDGESLLASDLVWNWCDQEFLRADSQKWLRSPLVDNTDLICAIRRAEWSDFERSVSVQKRFVLKR